MFLMRSTLLLSAFILLLAGCTPKPELPTLPEGPQTLTGTVVPTTISTSRRGTHVLKASGEDIAYLESSTVNLREFQGRSTALRGHFEHNIDREDLPVLVVESVVSSEESVRPWSSSSLSLTAEVPTRCGVSGTGAAVAFIPVGSLHPVVGLAFKANTPMPSGITLTVGGAKAIRFLDELSGEQRIAVERSGGYLEIAFTPQREDDLSSARAEWLAFLRSLKISGAVSAGGSSRAAVSSASSGTRDGQPCGGLAGILCPAGFYCAITDLEQNIGVCRTIE